jgi:molybdopterin-guanine dinucleotide biosynthesis protein A
MQTAAILAGGHARRLGGLDKSRLVIGGLTILQRQIALLEGVLDRVVVVVADGPERFADAGVPVMVDARPGCGSLGGIYTAVAGADGPVLVLACDMPFVTAPFLARVLKAGREADIAIPRANDGYHPLCACYGPACAAPIRRRLDAGTLKVTDLLGDVRVRELGPAELAPFDPEGLLLLNINTPDDLARAERAFAVQQRPPADRQGPVHE